MVPIIFCGFIPYVHHGFKAECSRNMNQPSFFWFKRLTMFDMNQPFIISLSAFFNHYPLVNKQLDPDNKLFLMETNLPTPMTGRVYVNLPTNITMENHHFSWENPLFQWSFSIAMLNLPEGNSCLKTVRFHCRSAASNRPSLASLARWTRLGSASVGPS